MKRAATNVRMGGWLIQAKEVVCCVSAPTGTTIRTSCASNQYCMRIVRSHTK